MKILVRLVSMAGKHRSRSSEAPTTSVFWIRKMTGELLPNQIADLDLDLDLGLGFIGIGNMPYACFNVTRLLVPKCLCTSTHPVGIFKPYFESNMSWK